MQTLRKMLMPMLLIAPLLALAGEKLNINTATAESLAEVIQGVGPSRAQAIVQYREKHGPFNAVDDLVLVQGIGLKTVEENREALTVE